MASYNHAAFIRAAIESVQQQDYQDWELLIADDASTDDTLQVLKSYENDSRIRVFPFSINRQHHMRNYAADYARGQYLAFLNSDDLFLPGKLSRQIELLEKESRLDAVFTHVKCIDENNVHLPDHPLEKVFTVSNQSRHAWLQRFFNSGNCLCISSAMIRRECFEAVGRFNPLLVQISDLDLWIRTCLRADIHIIPEKLSCMRILKHGKNLSDVSPATLSRFTLENQHIYNHYFTPEAIERAPEIFPDLVGTLPEDTPQWRHYLLCLKLIALPHRSMKLAGFTKLHELLADPKTTMNMMQQNPRLLHNLFIWEGVSGLNSDHPNCQWTVFVPPSGETSGCAVSHPSWTASLKKSTVCISFLNPEKPAHLCLTIAGKYLPFGCGQFRFYNQLDGSCIYETGGLKSSYFSKITNKPSRDKHYYFPEIDFRICNSKWIDLEIDCVPTLPGAVMHSIRRKMG